MSALKRVKAFMAQFLAENPGPEIVTVVGYHNVKRQNLTVADLREVVRLAERANDSPFDEPCAKCGGPHSDYDHEPTRRPPPKVAPRRTKGQRKRGGAS